MDAGHTCKKYSAQNQSGFPTKPAIWAFWGEAVVVAADRGVWWMASRVCVGSDMARGERPCLMYESGVCWR